MPWTFFDSSGRKLNTASTLIDNLDIDGATDIGADIVDADLFIIDDGAGGTNRKTAASRIKTYIGSAAVTRAGGDTSESTTTSTSAADVVSVGSISIAINDPFQLTFGVRKTAGAASKAGVGLKITHSGGSVTTCEAKITGSNMWLSSATDRAEDGMSDTEFAVRDSNYLNGTNNYFTARVSSSGGFAVGNAGGPTIEAPLPNAVITTLVLRGISTSSVTLGLKHTQIYSRSSS